MSSVARQHFPERKQSVNPKVWGRWAWNFIHTCALTYPEDGDHSPEAERRRDAFSAFLKTLPQILPCSDCRHHCAHVMAEVDPNVRDFDGVNTLVLHLHNRVNRRQGKDVITPQQVTDWLNQEDLAKRTPVVESTPLEDKGCQEGKGCDTKTEKRVRAANEAPKTEDASDGTSDWSDCQWAILWLSITLVVVAILLVATMVLIFSEKGRSWQGSILKVVGQHGEVAGDIGATS